MGLQITDFMTAFSSVGGGLSINHFMVTFTPPATMPTISSFQNLSVLCEAVPLPGLQIATTDHSMPYGYGPNYKMPMGVVFNDLDLRFMGDAKGYVHNIFTTWLNSIVASNVTGMGDTSSSLTPYLVNYLDDIASTVTITAYDPIGNQIITYTLKKAYPSFIGDISGDWGAQDQLMKIPVKFNFVNWKVTYSQITSSQVLGNMQNTFLQLQNQGISYNSQQTQLPISNFGLPATSTPAFQSLPNSYVGTLPSLSTSDLFE